MAGLAIFTLEKTFDAALLEQYRQQGRATVAAHGGRALVTPRSVKPVVEGEPENVIVIEFPTLEQARAWYESPEYRAASELRKRACRCHVILTETT